MDSITDIKTEQTQGIQADDIQANNIQADDIQANTEIEFCYTEDYTGMNPDNSHPTVADAVAMEVTHSEIYCDNVDRSDNVGRSDHDDDSSLSDSCSDNVNFSNSIKIEKERASGMQTEDESAVDLSVGIPQSANSTPVSNCQILTVNLESRSLQIVSDIDPSMHTIIQKTNFAPRYTNSVDFKHGNRQTVSDRELSIHGKEQKAQLSAPIVFTPDSSSHHRSQFRQSDGALFVCQQCDYVTDKKTNWYKHTKVHNNPRDHACEFCQYRAKTASNLKRHILIHTNTKSFECGICEQTFRQKIHLDRHLYTKHEGSRTIVDPRQDAPMPIKVEEVTDYICGHGECGFTSNNRKDVQQHEKFHKTGPELKLFCKQCSFVTDCLSRLKRHLLTHTDEFPYACEFCKYRSRQKAHLSRHQKTKHGVAPSPKRRRADSATEKTVSPKSGDSYVCKIKMFKCSQCSMSFSKVLNLHKHVTVMHPLDLVKEDGVEKCVMCDYKTSNKKNLVLHMRKHNQTEENKILDIPSKVYNVTCILCNATFHSRTELQRHIRSSHTNFESKESFTPDHVITSSDNIRNNIVLVENAPVITEPVQSGNDSTVIQNVSLLQSSIDSLIGSPSAISQTTSNVSDNHVETIDPIRLVNPLTDELEEHEETETLSQDDSPFTKEDSELILKLSSGDRIEINGEVYQVQIK